MEYLLPNRFLFGGHCWCGSSVLSVVFVWWIWLHKCNTVLQQLQTTSVSLGFCKLIFPANALVVVRWEGCWNGACVNNLYIIIVSYIGRDTWLHTGSSKLDHEQEQTMIDNDAKVQPLPESRRRQQLLRT